MTNWRKLGGKTPSNSVTKTSINGIHHPLWQKHDELVYGTLMDMLRPTYEAAKKRTAEGSTDTLKRGVGIALACYCVGDETCDSSDAAMALLPDGKFAMYNTWEDHGQGADIGCITLTRIPSQMRY